MKKLKVFGLAAMAVGMVTLTSCLSGGGNTGAGAAFGYAEYSAEAKGIVVKDDYGMPVAATAFNSQLMGQEYVQYAYSIDYDNQPSSKYITATVSAVEKYPEYQVSPYLMDTATILPREMTVKQISAAAMDREGTTLLTANKHAFVAPIHPNIAKDMKVRYEMSYNGQQEPVTVDGKRVYDLYVRAMKVADGTNTTQDFGFIGAYDLRDFLNRTEGIEKSAGNETVNIRFNYINEFNKDSTTWNWAKSSVFQYLILEDKK